VNVHDVDKARVSSDSWVAAALAVEEARLGPLGRVLVRPSGTEPLVRVMVEAAEADLAAEVAECLAAVIKERLALSPG
jgi:phosphoglucosamine mutase